MNKKNLRKVTIFLVIFLFPLTPIFCQNSIKADSIRIKLNESELQDTVKIKLIISLLPYLSNPDQIISYSNDLDDLVIRSGKISLRAYSLHHLGTGNRLKGNSEIALKSLFKAAEIAKSNNNLAILGSTYAEISNCYTLIGNNKNALKYNTKVIEIFRETGDEQRLAINLLNIGYDYFIINSLDTALAYYNEAEPLFEEIGLEIGKAYTIGNRALVYWKQGKPNQAQEDLLEAISMLEPLGDQYGMADYYNQLGAIALEQGETASAIDFTKKGLEMAIAEDLKEQVRDASLLLSKLYEEKNDFKKAYQYQTEYMAYKDSIQDRETTQRLADLRTDFEVGQKQAELDLVAAEKEAERKQSLIIGAALSIFLLLIAVLAVVLYRSNRLKQSTNRVLTDQKQALESQKQELERVNATKDKFFSIISHDLRGPVASFFGISKMIEMYVRYKKTEDLMDLASDIDQSVERLSNLLDNLLSWATQQQGQVPYHPVNLSVNNMARNIKVALQNMANGKEIELITQVDDSHLVYADQNTAETILRNLTSNALKFTPEQGTIKIMSHRVDDSIQISVVDTGVGIPKAKMASLFSLEETKSTYGTKGEKGLGLGLQLVDEFTKLNGGTLQVESEEGKGSTFSFTLPEAKA